MLENRLRYCTEKEKDKQKLGNWVGSRLCETRQISRGRLSIWPTMWDAVTERLKSDVHTKSRVEENRLPAGLWKLIDAEPFQNVHGAIHSAEIQQLKAPGNCRDEAVLQEMPPSLILPSRLVAFLIGQKLGKNPETCLDVPYSCLVINWTCYYRGLICHHSDRVDWCLFHCTVSHKGRW